MKPVLTIFFVFLMNILFAQTPKGFDYTIILGGCFNQDLVSMKVNNRVVFKNYMINNNDPSTRGNLNFVQDEQGIRINYNGSEENRRAVDFDFILDIKFIVNKQVQRFSIDLRKGNIILFDFCPDPGVPASARKLSTEQLQEPFLFM